MKKSPAVTDIVVRYADKSADHFTRFKTPDNKVLPFVWSRKRLNNQENLGAFAAEEIALLLYKTALNESLQTYYVVDPSVMKPMRRYINMLDKFRKMKKLKPSMPHGDF